MGIDLEKLLSEFITIEESVYNDTGFTAYGTLLQDAGQTFNSLTEQLKPFNLIPVLRMYKETDKQKSKFTEIKIISVSPPSKERIWLNVVLFIATLFSTIIAGSFLAGMDPIGNPGLIFSGIPFSIAILFILSSHEFGHYIACKSNRIAATLPYFIPFPGSPIGTFGAVIKIKSPIQDKNRLIEVGASGPLCGFLAAIIVSIIGLNISRIVQLQQAHVLIGNSIAFWSITKLFAPQVPAGYDILLHPVAFAGWLGMFITSINLLPVGQLDGGHIVYAFFQEKAQVIGWAMIAVLPILGIFWHGWLIWTVIIFLLTRLKHPPPLNTLSQLSVKHKVIGVLALIVFVLSFVPIPFKM